MVKYWQFDMVQPNRAGPLKPVAFVIVIFVPFLFSCVD